MNHEPRDRAAETTDPDLGAVRRTLACARTLLDEIERSMVRSPRDRLGTQSVAHQAVEELTRLACMLTPSVVSELLQDGE